MVLQRPGFFTSIKDNSEGAFQLLEYPTGGTEAIGVNRASQQLPPASPSLTSLQSPKSTHYKLPDIKSLLPQEFDSRHLENELSDLKVHCGNKCRA